MSYIKELEYVAQEYAENIYELAVLNSLVNEEITKKSILIEEVRFSYVMCYYEFNSDSYGFIEFKDALEKPRDLARAILSNETKMVRSIIFYMIPMLKGMSQKGKVMKSLIKVFEPFYVKGVKPV